MTNSIPMDVIIGVDTHKDVHTAAAISGAGVHLATTTIPASSKGYGALEAWAKSPEPSRRSASRAQDPMIDPLTVWRALAGSSIPTFAKAVENYLALHGPLWNREHARQWRVTVDTYCKPLLKLPVDQIDTAAVLKVLTPIWSQIPETASRIRGRIETILDFAKLDEDTKPNPARWRGHLAKKLPNPKEAGKTIERDGVDVRVPRNNFAALPYASVPTFAARLRAEEGVAARALEFLLLTVARSGEALGAKWSEMDFDARTWTIPVERLKTGKKTKRPHRVPLTARALAILEEMRAIASNSFVFPGRFAARPLTGKALLLLLTQRLGYDGLTVHGLRSSFRDYVGEETEFSGELAEFALAHIVRGVEGKYRRGDALEKRRKLMDAWAAYCESPPPSDETAADNVLLFESISARAV